MVSPALTVLLIALVIAFGSSWFVGFVVLATAVFLVNAYAIGKANEQKARNARR